MYTLLLGIYLWRNLLVCNLWICLALAGIARVFQSVCPNLYSHERSSAPYPQPTLGIAYWFYFSHSGGYVVVSYYSFNLQFSENYVSVLFNLGHLNNSFSKKPVPVFRPFVLKLGCLNYFVLICILLNILYIQVLWQI